MNARAHKVTSFFVAIRYKKMKQRRMENRKVIGKYVMGLMERLRFLRRERNTIALQ
jgi:hypothetical protein